MGWCKSQPFFCSGSETVRDLIKKILLTPPHLPPHKFKACMMRNIKEKSIPIRYRDSAIHEKAIVMSMPSCTLSGTHLHFKSWIRPIDNVGVNEVYVDGFIGATQNLTQEHRLHFSRTKLHGVHSIFPPLHVTNHPGGDSISKRKLDKGEEEWYFAKEILRWIYNGKSFTIQLISGKIETILKLIKNA